MSKLNSLIQSFGFYSQKKVIKPYDYDVSDYVSSEHKKLDLHKAYLKEIENEENNRLNIIENKTSQIISQTGLIFSLLSLFIPFIIDKVLDFDFYLKSIFIIVLAFAYLFYILTINNALRNFNVKKFNYIKNSPISIINQQNLKVEEFTKMEIKDSLLAIKNNVTINNLKASNLISAYNSFRFGNIFTSILVIFLCASLLFIEPKSNAIKLEDPIEINHFEEYIEALKEQNKILKEEIEKAQIVIKKKDTAANNI